MRKGIFAGALFVSVLSGIAASVFSSPLKSIRSYSQQKYYTFTLNSSNFSFLPTSAGTGQSDVNNSPRTSSGNPIIIAYGQSFRSGSRIRMTKNSGYLSNVTAMTGLRAITVALPSGRANLSIGNAYNSYSTTVEITNGMRYEVE